MIPENVPQPSAAILPEQVWQTLNRIQQQTFLQAMIQLCQQMIETWEEEVKDEQPPTS